VACGLLLFAVAAAAWRWGSGPALALATAGAAALAAPWLEPEPRAAADGTLWLALFVPTALGLALGIAWLRVRSGPSLRSPGLSRALPSTEGGAVARLCRRWRARSPKSTDAGATRGRSGTDGLHSQARPALGLSGYRSRDPSTQLQPQTSSSHDAERLRDELKARDELVCFAAHELRTPLSVLRLQLQALRRAGLTQGDRLGPKRLDKTLALALRQVERLTRLVDDLIEISRVGLGDLRLEACELDLSALARELVTSFQAQADASGSTVSLDADAPAVGRWDRLRIEQVASNLLSNALKYGAGKPVEIIVRADAATAWLVVRDRGIGMTPAERERIFAPFVRADSVRRRYEGLGVGLYLSRRIVEAHGGTLDVQSSYGAGSTFTVSLPRHLLRAASAEKPDADAYLSQGIAPIDAKARFDQITPSRE
jgi:signal transduction histidine kinase